MPPLQIDIRQMIDLALGTPEIGVVNFTVLHSLLHAMSEVLNLNKHYVEFRGSHGIKIEKLIQHIPKNPIYQVEEFKAEEAVENGRKTLKRTPIKKVKSDKIEKILVIQKTGDSDKTGVQQQPVHVVSADDFRNLDPRGTSIHDPVGRALPANQDLFDSARGESEDSRNPVGEMWQMLNITKRVDATELAIEKITSMVRDMSEEYRNVRNSMERMNVMSDVSHLNDKLDNLEKQFHDRLKIHSIDRISSKPRAAGGQTQAPNQASVPSQQKSPDSGPQLSPPEVHVSTEIDPQRKPGGAIDAGHRESNDSNFMSGGVMNDEIIAELNDLRREVEGLKNLISNSGINPKAMEELMQHEEKKQGGTIEKVDKDLLRRLELLETKLSVNEHQLFDMEKELAELVDRFEDDQRPAGTNVKGDVTGIADIYAQVSSMKNDLETTMDRCNFLMIERDQMAENLENANKKLEEIKVTKVEKDEIDELLAEKADYNMLQRKVSVEQFDATKRHLSNGLVEALEKLTVQGEQWGTALEDIKSLLSSKVGQEELDPLKEYVDGKIQAIQERLKAVALLRRDPEAAGTRNKYLRQVNCISCDQDVIMRLDEPNNIPRPDSMPAQSTLKPFLVYELDSIRKQMKDPNARNLHHFEVMSKDKQPQNAAIDGKPKKLVSRYCGGSHTVLTPQDRAQRCKFDKRQYPKECFIKSDEGCYYRAINKRCLCPERKPQGPETKLGTGALSARSSKSELARKQSVTVTVKYEEPTQLQPEPIPVVDEAITTVPVSADIQKSKEEIKANLSQQIVSEAQNVVEEIKADPPAIEEASDEANATSVHIEVEVVNEQSVPAEELAEGEAAAEPENPEAIKINEAEQAADIADDVEVPEKDNE